MTPLSVFELIIGSGPMQDSKSTFMLLETEPTGQPLMPLNPSLGSDA
jgi:hypothetical protein